MTIIGYIPVNKYGTVILGGPRRHKFYRTPGLAMAVPGAKDYKTVYMEG